MRILVSEILRNHLANLAFHKKVPMERFVQDLIRDALEIRLNNLAGIDAGYPELEEASKNYMYGGGTVKLGSYICRDLVRF